MNDAYKKDVYLLIFFAILLVSSFYADSFVLSNVNKENVFLMFFGEVGYWLVYAIVPLLLLYFFLLNRKLFPALAVAYFSNFVITYLIKFLILRPRPFGGIYDPSFPSAHASFAFVAIMFFKGRQRVIVAIIAVLIAISRIAAGAHYLSDIVAGAMLGYLIGLLCYDERDKIRQFLIPFSRGNRK